MALRISTVIRETRKEKGLTQESLAELIGVTPGYIGQLERNETTPQIILVVLTRKRDKHSNPGTFQHTFSRAIEVCGGLFTSNHADLCRLRVKMGAEI